MSIHAMTKSQDTSYKDSAYASVSPDVLVHLDSFLFDQSERYRRNIVGENYTGGRRRNDWATYRKEVMDDPLNDAWVLLLVSMRASLAAFKFHFITTSHTEKHRDTLINKLKEIGIYKEGDILNIFTSRSATNSSSRTTKVDACEEHLQQEFLKKYHALPAYVFSYNTQCNAMYKMYGCNVLTSNVYTKSTYSDGDA